MIELTSKQTFFSLLIAFTFLGVLCWLQSLTPETSVQDKIDQENLMLEASEKAFADRYEAMRMYNLDNSDAGMHVKSTNHLVTNKGSVPTKD